MVCLQTVGAAAPWFLVLLLCGCGGAVAMSSASPVAVTSSFPPESAWTLGVFQAPAACASLRTGTDPSTGCAFADATDSVVWEICWLRTWSNAYCLWYRELMDQNPGAYAAALAYCNQLNTTATTTAGAARDRCHSTYSTPGWLSLSQPGVAVRYGADWALRSNRPPQRRLVAYLEAGSAAAVLMADGVDEVNTSDQACVDKLNAALFPYVAATQTFRVRDPGETTTRSVMMTASAATSVSVQNLSTSVTGTALVDYFLFRDPLTTAERQLVDAFTQLQSASISTIVIDRHCSGGTITPKPYHAKARGFSVSTGAALPTLNLARVYLLTPPGTWSASESIINSLRGAGVEVIQVGWTTCSKAFGDYTDSVRLANTAGCSDVRVPGCSVTDDFTPPIHLRLLARRGSGLVDRVDTCRRLVVAGLDCKPQR